jgi:Fic family protein
MLKECNYKALSQELLSIDVMQRLLVLQQTKGKMEVYQQFKEPLFDILQEKALLNDLTSMPISCSKTMVENNIIKKFLPKNVDSKEIVNYYELLKKDVYKNQYKAMISKEDIISLHSQLFHKIKWAKAGVLKTENNGIKVYSKGRVQNVLSTIDKSKTKDYLDEICDSFNQAIKESKGYEIVAISLFIVDLMYVYPFNYGNQDLIRVVLQLLLYRCGYRAVKYSSVQKIIKSVDFRFNETLKYSLGNRRSAYLDDKNVYAGFFKLLMLIVSKVYDDLCDKVESVPEKGFKYDRIKLLFDKKNKEGKYVYLNKKEIMEMCPDISTTTIERALTQLVKSNCIKKLGYTTCTHYQKNTEKIEKQ